MISASPAGEGPRPFRDLFPCVGFFDGSPARGLTDYRSPHLVLVEVGIQKVVPVFFLSRPPL